MNSLINYTGGIAKLPSTAVDLTDARIKAQLEVNKDLNFFEKSSFLIRDVEGPHYFTKN